MPMTMGSILSRPCLSGLRMRPRRLFGFDGTTDADPRSPTGSITPGAFGPAPATAPARIADPAIRDLQGAGGVSLARVLAPPPAPHPLGFAESASPRSRGEVKLIPHPPEIRAEAKRLGETITLSGGTGLVEARSRRENIPRTRSAMTQPKQAVKERRGARANPKTGPDTGSN